MLKEGILMRIPDCPNVHGGKYLNHWTTKINRVEKAHESAFENELEDYINKKNLLKNDNKKTLKNNIRLSLTKPMN